MGSKRLNALRRRWRAESFLYCGLLTVAGSVLFTVLLHAGAGWPLWVGWPIAAVLGVVVLWRLPFWRMTVTDIARYLDGRIPEMEESCGLLVRDPAELGLLERLQAERVAAKLEGVVAPDPLRKKLMLGMGVVLAAVLVSAGLAAAGHRMRAASRLLPPVVRRVVPPPPGIRAVHIHITPPAYTGRPTREQADFGLKVEEGAVVGWELETGAGVDTVAFIFNDSDRVLLRAADAGHTVWRFTEKAMRSGFYQVHVGGQSSALYQLEVLPDEPPQVVIETPKPYTVVDYGEPTVIPLRVRLKDDYGITDASIVATVSSGAGEAVKFKQQEMRWNFPADRAAYSLSKVLDLGALGLKPGDELYFYCRARDSRGQEGRTETYIISLADTARLMSLEGITMSTDVKPAFFRSERQIIIETEQLLKVKDTMVVTAFRDKSNDLGIDQKLLRLRYGQFLGEEAEEGELGTGGGQGDTTDFGTFGDATRILDVFTDKHDNAEDATYFEPGVKQQLKATLSEMWKAELQLRTFHPQDALPFAYKALRLLKDLQQQSRAYVAKTGVKVTPLDPAKRLTGELGAIGAPVQEEGGFGLPEGEVLRMALAVLEGEREMRALGGAYRGMGTMAEAGTRVGVLREAGTRAGVLGEADRRVLQEAGRRVGAAAVARPSVYVGAYEELKGILAGKRGDIVVVERAIRQLLPEAEVAPGLERGRADGGLGKLYFKAIGK
jgi:hypothetical protein